MVVDDMFFAAKIRGAADSAGRQVVRVKSSEQLKQFPPDRPPALLIIDLNSESLNPIQAIELLKTEPELSAVPIIGFLSHIQTDLKRAAELAGCDYVVPRSVFTQMLPQIMAGDLSSLKTRQPHNS